MCMDYNNSFVQTVTVLLQEQPSSKQNAENSSKQWMCDLDI